MQSLSNSVQNLLGVINKNLIECLNQNDSYPVHNAIFDSKVYTYLESDVDEQLLIKITFTTTVKLHSIDLQCLNGNNGPKTIKLYINKPEADFDVCESSKPTQVIKCEKKEKLQLTLDKMQFQKVNQLVIFVTENHGAEQTQINLLSIMGQPLTGTDINQWKPVKG